MRGLCLGKESERFIVAMRLQETGAIPPRGGAPGSRWRRDRSLPGQWPGYAMRKDAEMSKAGSDAGVGRVVLQIAFDFLGFRYFRDDRGVTQLHGDYLKGLLSAPPTSG